MCHSWPSRSYSSDSDTHSKNDALQKEGRQGRTTWHRVEKLLCSQRALCRCQRLAGWEIHTLELLFVPTPEKGVFLRVHPLHVCHRHQWGGAVAGMWWAARTMTASQGHGLNKERQLSAAQQLPPFHTHPQHRSHYDRSDLCRLMSRVKQKQSCCQHQSEPATVCQNMDAGSAVCFSHTAPWHTSQEAENQAKTNKQKWDRRKLLHVAYKAISCKMEVSHAVISWLVQSVKLRAGDSNAI